jgi:hypothetical protein
LRSEVAKIFADEFVYLFTLLTVEIPSKQSLHGDGAGEVAVGHMFYFFLVVFFTPLTFKTTLPLYEPQKEQAVCGLTALPHLEQELRVLFLRARWARLRPTALLVRRFFGFAILFGYFLYSPSISILG